MTRWTEIDGKYVDLDEVRAVELVGSAGNSNEYAAILTVPGGSVTVPIHTSDAVEMPYPLDRDPEPPPSRPGLFAKRATRQAWREAWDAWDADRKRLRAENERARREYDSARWTARRRSAEAKFEVLVCEIGAKDCT